MSDNNLCITIAPSKFTRFIAIIAVFLILISVTTQVFKYTTGHDHVYGLIELFYLGNEHNIPTFFSALILLLAAILIGIIGVLKRKVSGIYRLHWMSLAYLFLFLATDEASGIHEMLQRPTVELIGSHPTGIFFFPWVIPGIALVVVLAFIYLRFWLHLPSYTRLLVFVAGSLYIAGAIGVEMTGGYYAELHGMKNFTYSMIVTIEESLEMAGIILFIFALLDYIENNFSNARLHLTLTKANN